MNERVDQAIYGMLTLTSQSTICDINNTLLFLTGYEKKEELLGESLDLLMDASAQFYYYAAVYPQMEMEGECQEIYLTLKRKDASTFPVMFNAKKFSHQGQSITDCVILPMVHRQEYLKEIKTINKKLESLLEEKNVLHRELLDKQNELLEANERLRKLSSEDALTGIANRRAFMEQLALEIKRSKETQYPFFLCLLDLDYFKAVNDLHGHQTGDLVLMEFATFFRSFFGDPHTVARFGGEEFILLLRDTGEREALERIESFRAALSGRTFGGLTITASFGVTTRTVEEADALIMQSDTALYEAKKRGRNRVVHYRSISETIPAPV